ncbi:uncharacterized protein EAE97_010850 [Botrytis byssoidea]|uniref:Uncharacterized protein n=1 Tax=Botrytis byssoidea TaxID=139641 RepID=A0A9P5HYV7_9HELO|nr:uncharacterized protein EAE97_010850 [Botrytis byssoidea]KAF7923412.1 hypothetical protein EAE97_010850 [Botrytis byssoidea]
MAESKVPSNQTLNLPSHILYQNFNKTVTLIDIPQSIEDAQSLSSEQYASRPKTEKRLISCKPIDTPYPSLEPKSAKALRNAPEKRIEELMLERYVQLALDEMMRDERWEGKVCLERIWGEDEEPKRKRKFVPEETEKSQQSVIKVENASELSKHVDINGVSGTMPPKSTMIFGNIPGSNISSNIEIHQDFPKFKVIIADPPWPNRSAFRKDSYATASGFGGIESLLRFLPCHKIEHNGYVGIWITNKPAFRSMLLDKGGMFDHWGLELIEEWIWLKVTSNGEPMCEILGTWRKPWEILLVGRKKDERESVGVGDSGFKKSVGNEELNIEKEYDLEGSNQSSPSSLPSPSPSQTPSQSENSNLPIKRRIIIGVPDLHSRKPNLRFLFGQLLGLQDYRGLEIFARNLTAGWWGWGNELLKFQNDDAWVVEEGCDDVDRTVDVLKVNDGHDREDEKSDRE